MLNGQRALDILKNSVVLSMLNLVGKGFGMMRDIIVAAKFGTGWQMDAFLLALSICEVFYNAFTTPIRITIIPWITKQLQRDDLPRAWRDIFTLFNVVAILGIALAVMAALASPWLIKWLAPGFDGDTYGLAVNLLKILSFIITSFLLVQFLTNISQVRGKFFVPGLDLIINNSVTIVIVVLLASGIGIYSYGVGLALGSLITLIVLLGTPGKAWRMYRPVLKLKREFVEIFRKSIPVFVSSAGSKLDVIIDRFLASMLPVGSISALGYATRVFVLPIELISKQMGIVLFPHYSDLAVRNEVEQLRRWLFTSLDAIFFYLLPITCWMLLMAEEILRVLFTRGAFDLHSLNLTTTALQYYVVGLVPFSASNILTTNFYSRMDTRTPMKLSLGRVALKIMLSLLLIPGLAHNGLALATSLSFTIKSFALFFSLPRDMRGREARVFARSIAKIIAAGGLSMGILLVSKVWWKSLWPWTGLVGQIFLLLGSAAVFGIVFLLGCHVFRYPGLPVYIKYLRRLAKRK